LQLNLILVTRIYFFQKLTAMIKKWVAVSFNSLETKLKQKIASKGYNLQRVKLPPNINIQLEVNLEEEAYKKVATNPTFLQRLQSRALQVVDKTIDDIADTVIDQDKKSIKFNAQIAATFSADLTNWVKTKMEAAGKEMVIETDRMFMDLKRTHKELTRFQVKSGFKIGLSAVSIVAGTTLSIFTSGALSPLGIVGIVRSCVTIAQECGKLASTCGAMDKVIKGEFAVLKKILSPSLQGKSTSSKAMQGAKEIGLNMLSKTTGIESPSMKNLKTHLDLMHANIAKLDKSSEKLSKQIYGVMDAAKQWDKEFTKAKLSLPAMEVGKIKMSLDSSEKTLDTLLKNTIKVNESINQAHESHKNYTNAYTAMSAGIPGWVGKVDSVLGFIVDFSTGLADASSAIEKGCGTMITVVTALADEAIDPASERFVPMV
jgi:hypothetical protein